MDLSPEFAALVHQQIQHQHDLLTMLTQILQTLQRLTERVAAVEGLLTAILESEEEETYDD